MATALSDVAFDDDMFMMSHSAYQPLDVSLLPELPLSADSVAVSDAILSKPAPAGQSQSRKRRYGSYLSGKSCLECYNRKRKCSGGRPCKHCVKLDRGHLCVDRNEENVPVPLRKKPRVEFALPPPPAPDALPLLQSHLEHTVTHTAAPLGHFLPAIDHEYHRLPTPVFDERFPQFARFMRARSVLGSDLSTAAASSSVPFGDVAAFSAGAAGFGAGAGFGTGAGAGAVQGALARQRAAAIEDLVTESKDYRPSELVPLLRWYRWQQHLSSLLEPMPDYPVATIEIIRTGTFGNARPALLAPASPPAVPPAAAGASFSAAATSATGSAAGAGSGSAAASACALAELDPPPCFQLAAPEPDPLADVGFGVTGAGAGSRLLASARSTAAPASEFKHASASFAGSSSAAASGSYASGTAGASSSSSAASFITTFGGAGPGSMYSAALSAAATVVGEGAVSSDPDCVLDQQQPASALAASGGGSAGGSSVSGKLGLRLSARMNADYERLLGFSNEELQSIIEKDGPSRFMFTPKKTAEQQFLICGSMFGGASVDVRILGVVVSKARRPIPVVASMRVRCDEHNVMTKCVLCLIPVDGMSLAADGS